MVKTQGSEIILTFPPVTLGGKTTQRTAEESGRDQTTKASKLARLDVESIEG